MNADRIGPYRIERRLGSGGMGAVFLAVDPRLGRRVALKSVHPDRELSPERRERLRREARAAAAISHPAVAQVYDILEEADGRDWVVMEYVEGRSIAEMLAQGPLDPQLVVSYGAQIAEGLAAAHGLGIVHRDLKAENVLVSADGRIKILDFGLAKRLDSDESSLTQEGMVMGTTRAMSPEQARGERVDHRSDLFSLGSLLYQMVTGTHPFQGETPLETMRRVVNHRPPLANTVREGIPEELALLIESLLEKNREHRPQTAEEVAAALRVLERMWATQSSRSLSLDRLTAQARRRRWRRRWWLAVPAAALLAAVGFAVNRLANAPKPPTLVAVLPVETSEPSLRPSAELVRVTATESVAVARGLAAADPSTLRGVEGLPARLLRAAGASQGLTGEVQHHGGAIRIELRRLDDAGRIVWSGSATVPPDDDATLVRAVRVLVGRAYPGRLPNSTADPAAFAEYARLAAVWANPPPGTDVKALLERAEAVAQRHPDLPEAAVLAAGIARYLAEARNDPAFLARARAMVRAAQRIAPEDPRVLGAAARIALAADDLEGAAVALDALERVAPGGPQALGLAATLARHRENSSEALRLYQRLAEAYPSALNWWRFGDALLEAGKPDAARAALQKGLDRAPANRFLRAKLAELELLYGDLARAESLFEALTKDFPNPVYAANLGLSRLLANDLAGAEAAFRTAYELAPDDPLILVDLADCLELEGRHDQAGQLYAKALAAISQTPQPDPDTLAVRAQCLAHLGRAAEAVTTVQELLARSQDPEDQLTAAVVYAVAGERLSARAALKRALAGGIARRWLNLPWLREIAAELSPD